jgi:hypothetical protein
VVAREVFIMTTALFWQAMSAIAAGNVNTM